MEDNVNWKQNLDSDTKVDTKIWKGMLDDNFLYQKFPD